MASSQTKKTPRVSVVMPAYNAEPFIGEVIATILGQTFKDFELVILDDGSSDGTAEIIKNYAKIDDRVKYHYQKNQGSARLGETINTAVGFAKGEWIARADSDDPWFLDKLEKQIAFVDSHPDYILIGGGTEIVNERGVLLYTLYGPIDDDDNHRSMALYTTLAHGSVMFKKSIFTKLGGYKNIHSAEDLELWQRMGDHGKIYNIPEPLFKYRKNTQGISMQNQELQTREVERLGIEYFKSHQPRILSTQEFRDKLSAINDLRGKSILPDYYVDELLMRLADDNVRIARLFIKYGDKNLGYKQLTNIALSGRLGFKTAMRFIKKNLAFRMTRVWKKA